jgi:hypothetical protein
MSNTSIAQKDLEYDQENNRFLLYGNDLAPDRLVRLIDQDNAYNTRTIHKLNRRIRSQHDELLDTKRALTKALGEVQELSRQLASTQGPDTQERNEYAAPTRPDHMHNWQHHNIDGSPWKVEWKCAICGRTSEYRQQRR